MRHRGLRKAVGTLLATGLLTGAAVALTATAALAIPPSCDDPEPPPICFEDPDPPVGHDPWGTVVNTRRVPGGVWVTGYAYDPDGPGITATMQINNTVVANLVANLPEPELGNAGFEGVIPAVRGNQVCGIARNVGPGNDGTINCDGAYIPFEPYGSLDAVALQGTQVSFAGWAIDPDIAGPVLVDVYQDGALARTVTADVHRPDVGAAHWRYGDYHGFNALVPERPTDGVHTLCAVARHVVGTGGAETDTQLGCKTYTVRHNPTGTLDTVTRSGATVTARGTATDPDVPAEPTSVHIYHDGAFATEVVAAAGDDAYTATIPATMTSGSHTICAYAINRGLGTVNTPLGCRDYSVPAPLAPPTISHRWLESTKVDIDWTRPHASVTGYRMEQSVDGGPYNVVANPAASALTYLARGLTPWTQYCFRLVAINDISESSVVDCVRTLHEALPATTAITFPQRTETTITVSWQDNAENETSHLIDVYDMANGTYVQSLTTSGHPGVGLRSHTVTGLASGRQYAISVRAHHPDYEDRNRSGLGVWTVGPPVVGSFTANPTAVQACVAQNVTLKFDVTDVHRVVVKRGSTVVFDNTTANGAFHQTISGGSNDGNVTYTLTAYSLGGQTTTRTATVQRTSSLTLVKQVRFTNWGQRQFQLAFVDLQGNVLEYLGNVSPTQTTTISVGHCVARRIMAFDAIDLQPVYDWTVLGHSDGGVYDQSGNRVG
ncbi:fibronectin type III domain-containing protein [Catellatospora citrea]|uniref:Fibronectin type-III domain-containing protein n=1 Tax=Catellatospora citrea TaxID=53366 RepID=A0A8J3KJQ1_9ACTN|nr:fibronectin type III domain-containing protein [Catellatospora citrea]RKE05351.1 fibronectin type III domain protein [Catellatospora citrea]GIF98280.1 hypothetical protein Cci01nite_33740 [Catellatospora citrea]